MKYLFFILSILLLVACSSAKPSLSANSDPSTLRAKTLQGIDQALTPMITASDLREAFRLTIAYADSLHRSTPVKVSSEWWNQDITWVAVDEARRPVLLFVALAFAAWLTWILVAVLQERLRRL